MYHHKGYKKLGRTSSHRKALLRNLLVSLFKYTRIRTTLAISRELRRFAEKVITLGKKGNLSRVASVIQDKEVFKKIPQYIEKYKGRNGGYTRVIKIGMRKGDGAMQVIVELVD